MTLQRDAAPVGGRFHVYGKASCERVIITLSYRHHDGEEDHDIQETKSALRDGARRYDYYFVVSAAVAPARDYSIFADTLCGNPDAGPSDPQRVEVTPARMPLHVPDRIPTGAPLTIRGGPCYGNDTDHVRVLLSGPIRREIRARLSGYAFAATMRAPAVSGTQRLTIDIPDGECPGSTSAQASVLVAGAARPAPTQHASSPAAPSAVPAPTSAPPLPSAPESAAGQSTGPLATGTTTDRLAGSSHKDTQRAAVIASIALLAALGTAALVIRERHRQS
jgi:hypothetical protein